MKEIEQIKVMLDKGFFVYKPSTTGQNIEVTSEIQSLITTIESLQGELKRSETDLKSSENMSCPWCSNKNELIESQKEIIEKVRLENYNLSTQLLSKELLVASQIKNYSLLETKIESQKEEIERLRLGITTAIGIWEAMDSEDDAGNVMDKVIETFYVVRGFYLSKEGEPHE